MNMSGLNGIVDTQISRYLAICISLRFFSPLFLVWGEYWPSALSQTPILPPWENNEDSKLKYHCSIDPSLPDFVLLLLAYDEESKL